MIFEGPVLAWVTLALLPIALPVLLALILSRFLHLRMGCLTLAILVAVGLFITFGIAAYLDSGGSVVPGEVLDKKESIVYHLDGSWNRKMVAEIRYRSSDLASPSTLSLSLPPAPFDELHQGDFIEIRSSDPFGIFFITRLEGQKAISQFWSWAWDQPFLFLFGLGLLLVLAARFALHFSLPILLFLGGLVTIGSWWIASVAIPILDQSDTLIGSLNTVSGNVREIHPPYLGSGLQGWIATELFTPYDLILLDILPLGRSQPVLSVDAVDVGSTALRPGQSVNVEYSTSNPRFALVPDASRSYVWKNGLLSTLFALLALLGVGRVAFVLRERRQDPGDVFSAGKKRRSGEV